MTEMPFATPSPAVNAIRPPGRVAGSHEPENAVVGVGVLVGLDAAVGDVGAVGDDSDGATLAADEHAVAIRPTRQRTTRLATGRLPDLEGPEGREVIPAEATNDQGAAIGQRRGGVIRARRAQRSGCLERQGLGVPQLGFQDRSALIRTQEVPSANDEDAPVREERGGSAAGARLDKRSGVRHRLVVGVP